MKTIFRKLKWWFVRHALKSSAAPKLRTSDWLVAYHPCGCLAGAVSAHAEVNTILEFDEEAEEAGLIVSPHCGPIEARICARHRGAA